MLLPTFGAKPVKGDCGIFRAHFVAAMPPTAAVGCGAGHWAGPVWERLLAAVAALFLHLLPKAVHARAGNGPTEPG